MDVRGAVDFGFVLLTGVLTVAWDGDLAYAGITSLAVYWLVRNGVVERAARALFGGRRIDATLP